MYVPGTLSNVNNVLIDVGTGYFVEKVINEPLGSIIVTLDIAKK